MKELIIISCLIISCFSEEKNKFHKFKFGKEVNEFYGYIRHYDIPVKDKIDFFGKLKTYLENKEYIEKRNSEDLGFELGMNMFGHMTNDEYREYLLSQGPKQKSKLTTKYVSKEGLKINDIDYRDIGAVTEVKDQGHCGSCWAFSAVGCLESQYILETRKKVLLSEQELVDCSEEQGNRGCYGGWMDSAFEYVKTNGLTTSQDYPYVADDTTCIALNRTRVVYVDQIYDIEEGNETELALALLEHGPVSVAIDAGTLDFQFYKSGIYSDPNCSSDKLNHGVLLVGIGSQPREYYIVKNSWGKDWGFNGYIMMARNKNNMCGIATTSSLATISLNKD